MTDGNSTGTSELVRPEFTLIEGKVLFEGVNTSDRPGLWMTDGTAAGTSDLSVAGACSNGIFYVTPSAVDDDILFQNAVGAVAVREVSAAAILQ